MIEPMECDCGHPPIAHWYFNESCTMTGCDCGRYHDLHPLD